MKYIIDKNNYKNFDVIEKNKVTPRTYFIPYSSKTKLKKQGALQERYNSELVTVLSGEWDFRYYPKWSLLPDEIDTDNLGFDRVTVPSTWQHTGYEPPVYINARYEFDDAPPSFPTDCSVGVYRTFFNVSGSAAKHTLTFLGAISCIDVYINGVFVGYSEGAHNSAEFEVAEYVTKGKNELLVVVSKWSHGTYLECQDMFRENGIFRDVYLTSTASERIVDLCCKTSLSDGEWNLDVSVALEDSHNGDCSVEFSFEDDGKCIQKRSEEAHNTVKTSFGSLEVKSWNAEQPKLYELYITLKKDNKAIEVIRERIGFKRVEIKGEVFLFNGQNIKIKGVNHHDTDSETGYVMTAEKLERDILLMKKLNVNGVRTSHYPPDPVFLMLCDIYGLYVIDEADIETHGLPHINMLSNAKDWCPRYLDRVQRLYNRDKNRVCVTMWSLGNESGGWKNQDVCTEYLHGVSDIPVHYEAVIRTPRHSYDVVSEMYTHPDAITAVKNRSRGPVYKGKPFYLCEYCHAMGVGPGALEDYWKLFYSDDIFMGGCIWEWADHAVLHDDGSYTYGGDHGERKHDGNFCVDGLVYPDRTPHTGAYAMQNVYRPVRAQRLSDNLYCFTNTNRFLNASVYTIAWTLLKNGIQIDSGSLRLSIEPKKQKNVILAHKMTTNLDDFHINFLYTNERGEFVACEQIAINEICREPARRLGTPGFIKTETSIKVPFANGFVAFDRATGAMANYVCNGKKMLGNENGFELNLSRAWLDNDMNMHEGWRKLGLFDTDMKFKKIRSCYCDKEEGCVRLIVEYNIGLAGKKALDLTLGYDIYAGGEIRISVDLRRRLKYRQALELPRLGLTIELDGGLKNVKYYGRGDRENLPDFKSHTTVGIFSTTVEAMHEAYIRPQENGTHCETRYLCLTNNEGSGVILHEGDKSFAFCAHNYTQRALDSAAHREELKTSQNTCLSIDGFVRGTGTNSCGPNTLKQYTYDFGNRAKFSFWLMNSVNSSIG